MKAKRAQHKGGQNPQSKDKPGELPSPEQAMDIEVARVDGNGQAFNAAGEPLYGLSPSMEEAESPSVVEKNYE
eukprot:961450-Rhodomonas_salina.1